MRLTIPLFLIAATSFVPGLSWATEQITPLALNNKLTQLAALQFCMYRIGQTYNSSDSLTYSESYIQAKYPGLMRRSGPLSGEKILLSAKSACPVAFSRKIVIEGKKKPPVAFSVHASPFDCEIDSYWLSQLKRNKSLYLQSPDCLYIFDNARFKR